MLNKDSPSFTYLRSVEMYSWRSWSWKLETVAPYSPLTFTPIRVAFRNPKFLAKVVLIIITLPRLFKSAEIIQDGISAWVASLLRSFISMILLAAAVAIIFLDRLIWVIPSSSSFLIWIRNFPYNLNAFGYLSLITIISAQSFSIVEIMLLMVAPVWFSFTRSGLASTS